MPKTAHAKKARPYGGLPISERRQSRRNKLIEAGYDLFGTMGVNRTKIEQVCSHAGVGIRSLYDEFGSLEVLFRCVYDDVMDRAYEAIVVALRNGDSSNSVHALETGISAYLHQMLDDPRSGRIVSIESARLDSFLGSHRNDTLNRFAELTTHLLGDDVDLDPASKSIWSVMLAGALNELVITAVIADDPPDIDQLTRISTVIWARSLKSPT